MPLRKDAVYAWIITYDHLDKKKIEVVGPNGASAELVARLIAGDGQSFKVYDDDGGLYYSGRYIGPDDDTLFAPLDDYGMPNAGCTSIQYRNKNGDFETL